VGVDVVGAGSWGVFSLQAFSVAFLFLQGTVTMQSDLGRVLDLSVELDSLDQVSTDLGETPWPCGADGFLLVSLLAKLCNPVLLRLISTWPNETLNDVLDKLSRTLCHRIHPAGTPVQ
jgi:hypothetical protein